MDAFSYLSILISIVVGLALTHLLAGFAAMVRARARISPYWPLVAQMVLLFFMQVQLWWAMFVLRQVSHWSFPAFVVVLLQAVLLYLATAFLVPHVAQGEGVESGHVDLRECYFRESRWYFTALLFMIFDSLLKNFILTGTFQRGFDLAGHAAFFMLCVAGIASKIDRVHKTIGAVALLVFAAYIAVLFVALPT